MVEEVAAVAAVTEVEEMEEVEEVEEEGWAVAEGIIQKEEEAALEPALAPAHAPTHAPATRSASKRKPAPAPECPCPKRPLPAKEDAPHLSHRHHWSHWRPRPLQAMQPPRHRCGRTSASAYGGTRRPTTTVA